MLLSTLLPNFDDTWTSTEAVGEFCGDWGLMSLRGDVVGRIITPS